MARKKTAPKQTAISKESYSSFRCTDGGCIFVLTKKGWERFEACGEDTKCTCPLLPPMLPSRVEIGQAFVVTCEDNATAHDHTILSEGFVTFQKGFNIDPDHADDYCVAISERPGKWRYGHRGANRHRDQNKGYLDAVLLERGVVRLDRLNPDGTASIELGAIGFLDPIFSCDPWVQEELAKYRSKKSGSA